MFLHFNFLKNLSARTTLILTMAEMTDSTILHVKVRTKYTEVNIPKKEVAIKLNIQLASSLNLIWRSAVALICMKTFPVILFS